jgi:REP element-mobilizing transposase RayT
VNRKLGHNIWQRSFLEHVIRNERDYREIWEYIDANPGKWVEDRYYEP